VVDTPEQLKAKEEYNSWKRFIKRRPQRNDIETIELLWTGALAILNGEDREWQQILPRHLDDQENYGRDHIQTLMSMTVGSHGSGTFIKLAEPFLLVIIHPALLDCLSVDTAVGNLYNFISGSNGTRAVPFFTLFVQSLVAAHLGNSIEGTSVETTLIAISAFLRELLKREQRATFHDDILDLVTSLQTTAEILRIDKQSMTFQIITNRTDELLATIARANGLLKSDEEPQVQGVSTTVVVSTYPQEIVVPGGRHDNDNTDITKIQLLPTESEIRSDRAEFLPSTDRDQINPLTDQAERHLDTHFRLLRHDIFGELKDALAGLMNLIAQDTTFLDNHRINVGNVRAYTYHNAHISHVSFDQRRGLQPQISFNQQPALRKKSAAERQAWWQEAKRLEEGALLCFISAANGNSSLLFLTVSERRADSKKEYSLRSKEHRATIVAKLATRHQSDLELMTHLSGQRVRGVLIEFPGVILNSFIPILENLQNIQRQGRLPFRRWILPDRLSGPEASSEPLDIPPPLYARAPGFTFRLDTILSQPGRLSINPSTPNDSATIDSLETRTGLDRGQCEALLAALTREFALIQGPPGTGKSHLGVHIMRVLLASKREAKLGPIVVV
jgi:hypothetical protein